MDDVRGFVHSPISVERCYDAMKRSAVKGGGSVRIPGIFSNVAAAADAAYVEKHTGIAGFERRGPNEMESIYGGCAFNMRWEWPRGVCPQQRTPEKDGFYLYGAPRELWAGRVFGASDYNAVVVEGCVTEVDAIRRDVEVIFVRMTNLQKKDWTRAATNRKKRDQLKAWFAALGTTPLGNWDPHEEVVDVETVVVPVVDARTQDGRMEEWIGMQLERTKYVVAVAAESTALRMDEHGGSVKSEVKMVAQKSLPPEKKTRHLVFDFRKERPGFLVFVQSTQAGVPDLGAQCLLAGFLRSQSQS